MVTMNVILLRILLTRRFYIINQNCYSVFKNKFFQINRTP